MARQLKNQPGTWLPIAWEEYVGRDSSHGASFSTGWDDGSQSTLQILVDWQNGLLAEKVLLGFATFNGTTLSRPILPARHPYKSSQYAERILSAQAVCWESKLNEYVDFNQSVSAGAPISEYAYWLLTIGFHTPKYRVLSDTQLAVAPFNGGEWNRFCEVPHKMSVTMISREGRLWEWSDGPGATNPPSPLTAPIGVPIYSEEIHVKWRRVPRRGLFGNAGESDLYNQNILNSLNKVHSGITPLWGFEATPPPGSEQLTSNGSSSALRFIGIDSTPIGSPFDPLVQNLKPTSYNLYYDVDLIFHVWMPPAGNSGFQGHNLAPYPNNLWYLVWTRDGNNRIFQSADLSNVFRLTDT